MEYSLMHKIKPSAAVFVVLAIVALDQIGKLLASLYIPEDDAINILGSNFQLTLMRNATGMSSLYVRRVGNNTNILVMFTCLILIFLAIMPFVSRFRLRFRMLTYVSLYLVLSNIGLKISSVAKPNLLLSGFNAGWITKGVAVGFFIVIYHRLRSKITKFGLLLLIAAGTSNAISILLPPHVVVDFMYSQFLRNTIGIGVFNVADAFSDIGIVVIILGIFIGIYDRIKAKTKHVAGMSRVEDGFSK